MRVQTNSTPHQHRPFMSALSAVISYPLLSFFFLSFEGLLALPLRRPSTTSAHDAVPRAGPRLVLGRPRAGDE